jgi:BT4734-like, N-terminal domain
LQHSGLLCADLDALGDQLVDVRAKLLTSIHLWALFISPTGDGLKCIFRVPADAEKHKASFEAVKKHVFEFAGVQIDQSCSDVSRLCFLSYDPDVHLIPFEV